MYIAAAETRRAERVAVACICVKGVRSGAQVAEHDPKLANAVHCEYQQKDIQRCRAETEKEQSHSLHTCRMGHAEHTIGGSGLLLLWHADQDQA